MQLFSWDFFFSPAEHNRNSRFMNHGQTDCCVIFLDTSTFSSDCYLCIFELAISPMHIFEKDFYLQMHYDCYLPCHSTLVPNKHYIDSRYVLSSVFLICFYSTLFIFNLLFSFKKIIQLQTLHFCYYFFDLDILKPFGNIS